MPFLDFYKSIFFPQKISSITTLSSHNFAFVERIILDNGQSWVCKKLAKVTWLRKRERTDIDYSEQVASIVAVKLGISSSAHKIGDSYALPFNDNVFLFIPYCEGEVITNWSEEQSHILGRKLASIHQLKLPNTNAKAFPEIYLPKFYLESYAELVKFCNQNIDYQRDAWVVSHRDVHHDNVVWKNATLPMLIDWESTGFIHPFVELIGLAVNCANVQQGQFEPNLFAAAITGYRLQQGGLPSADDNLWQLCFHSWLLWMSYCLEQAWDQEVTKTQTSIMVLQHQLANMKLLYRQLA